MPLLELARQVEDRGFDSFYLPEHTHIPVSRRTPYPEGGELPERYKRVIDPFVGLAFVAARTGLEVGTCMSLAGQHDPIALAKAVASLDFLSSGRFVFGIGFGWNVEEFESHHEGLGRRRWDVVREKVEVMKALWRDDVASYEGDFVRLNPSWSWPKPVRKPHPPVLLGGGLTPGSRARTFERIATWADGWIAVHSVLQDDGFAADLSRLRSVWEGSGRDPALLRIEVLVQPSSPEQMRRERDVACRLGVDRLVLHLESRDGDGLLQALDDFALLV